MYLYSDVRNIHWIQQPKIQYRIANILVFLQFSSKLFRSIKYALLTVQFNRSATNERLFLYLCMHYIWFVTTWYKITYQEWDSLIDRIIFVVTENAMAGRCDNISLLQYSDIIVNSLQEWAKAMVIIFNPSQSYTVPIW